MLPYDLSLLLFTCVCCFTKSTCITTRISLSVYSRVYHFKVSQVTSVLIGYYYLHSCYQLKRSLIPDLPLSSRWSSDHYQRKDWTTINVTLQVNHCLIVRQVNLQHVQRQHTTWSDILSFYLTQRLLEYTVSYIKEKGDSLFA